MKVAVVTSSNAAALSKDDPILLDALRRAGHEAVHRLWDDGASYRDFDLAVIRSTWDYAFRIGEFRHWLREVATQVPLLNTPEILEWNLDKHYLLELAARGVAIVPTRIAADEAEAEVAVQALWDEGEEAIVKPVISCGSWGLSHLPPGTALERGKAPGPYLVQPFASEVRDQGELSLIYIAGQFQHAIRKTPKAGDIRVQKEFGASYRIETASDEALELGAAAIAACPGATLYARADIIERRGRLELMELELLEPELFLSLAPEAADTLVAAISRWSFDRSC